MRAWFFLMAFVASLTFGVASYANNGGNQGGGPGNSGNGDKASCEEGPPPGEDPSCH